MSTILKILADHWVYDVQVLSNAWMWYTILPGPVYLVFMILKWVVLTIPIWVPINCAFSKPSSGNSNAK